MKLEDVRDDMAVVITAGASGHPLRGHRAYVMQVTSPLPEIPPASLHDASMAQIAQNINSNLPEHRDARAFRKETLEAPFAWPHGQVLLSLRPFEAAKGRRWPFPYVTVSPDDIEPA